MTNRPKGKLFALLAIFVAIGLVTATGAFTSVQAQRTATIGVAGDASALIAIDGAVNGPAGDIVDETNGGEARINLTGAFGFNNNAQGINPNATTSLSPLVNVTNNGEETVTLNITVDSVSGGPAGFDAADITIINANGNAWTDQPINAGDTVQFGFKFDLQTDSVDLNDASFTIDLTINATSS